MAQVSTAEYVKCEGKKEKIFLRFNLEMVREAHLDIKENLSASEVSECQSKRTEGECVVDGILQQETRGSFKKDKECQVLLQSLQQTAVCPQNIRPGRRRACLNNSPSDDITIYFYKSNMLEDLGKGVPVVLNVTNSSQFLKCTFRSDKAVLTVECGEKDKLDLIFKNDPSTWPFVFYLTCNKDRCHRFESAECSGWFIHTESNYVCMAEQKDKDMDSEKYSFLISRSPNKTRSK